MLAHVPSFGRNSRGSPDFLAYPVPKACRHILGTRVPRRLGVARSASSPKAAQALGCSLTPGLRISAGSPAWHGLPQCPGCGHWVSYCCVAFVFGSGWRLGAGFVNPASPGWGLGWVCLGTVCGVVPLVSAVCGVRGWASLSACFWTCVVSCAPRLPPAVSGSGARCGRVCWARVSPVPSPSWLGCRGVFFALWFFLFFFFFFPGFVVPVPPSPFFRAGLVALFFFFFSFSVSLFPVVRCYWLGVAGFGWVVPLCLCGGPFFRCLLGGGLAVCGGVGGRFGGCGLFSCLFPLPPPPLFWGGGGLPVPPSAFPGLAHALACIQCCLPGCCLQWRSVWPRSGPMGRVGFVHGGLGAPSCRVRSWLCRLGGCARRLLVVLG